MALYRKETKERDKRFDFMSDEEIRMVDDYSTKIEQNRGHMQEYYTRWEKEQEAYAGDQPIVSNRPNSRVNILHANIEGQVAALVEQHLAVTCRGEGPSDQAFARWARIGLDWGLRKNRIKRTLERHERRRELFGIGWLKLHWNPDALNGFGLPEVTCTPLQSIFVDMKINDPARLQDAEYIAEVMPRSKAWAVEKFGEVAHNIIYGGSDRAQVFAKDKTLDDEDLFWYVQLWTKTDGKLRLIEFSDDGVLLADSFKEWTGKRFKDKANPKPFYRYNRYIYFLTVLYPEEGKLLGFGDGKLLRPLQDMLNDLYDQIRRAARPNRIFFDPNSEVDLADLDEDDGPVPCDDPNNNIRVAEVGKVNPALWQLVGAIHQETQRVTRFSELRMGQSSQSRTATESYIQQQQGATATDAKKLMLQETLTELCEYMLDMMMENYTEGAKAFRVDENKEDYEWIDFRQMNNIPVMVPPDTAFEKQFAANNPGQQMPKWMQLTDEAGNGATKSVDFDIEINIGAGLPKNKAFVFQMLDNLSKAVIEGKNVIRWDEFRKFLRDFVGLPLEGDIMPMLPPEAPPPQTMMPPGMPSDATVEGLGATGQPQTPFAPRPTGGLM